MANSFGEVTHNIPASRFELEVDGHVGHLDYERVGRRLVLTHTIVPPEIEGRGHGTALAQAALEHAKNAKLQVVPQCAFVRGYLAKHPEYGDLVRRD